MVSNDHTFSGPLYNPPQLFSSTVCDKGAWVVHMLRGVVGDADFFTILRRHAWDSAYGNVSTAGFQATCESVTGEDLDWFFQEWVYTDSGRPDYRFAWSALPAKGAATVRVTVRQAQSGALFKMPIPVGLVFASGDTTWHVLQDSLETQDFDLAAEPPAPTTWAVLGPSFPNPASSRMSIPFSLAAPGRVALRLYDASGRFVTTLFDGEARAGSFAAPWDGLDDSGRRVPAGIYFAHLSGAPGTLARKIALLP